MSQNKFMHPRNIYKKPPNFKEMAIRYPEFRKYTKADISGKITFDFKDPEALKALTTTLLVKDFGLNIDIPVTRLIPTVPLRLNYILWIEDLLDVAGVHQKDYSSVHGIDIGTGASCIYPLLAAKKNKWSMIASEVDNVSFQIAYKNIENNNLCHLVSLKLVEGDRLLKDIVGDEHCYTFTMCNPPFFTCEVDLDYASKSRSQSRPPPNNGNTGDINELIAPGGEVAFIKKMMKESKEIGNKVRIYTSMVGQKSSLILLKQELKNLQVSSLVETRFCQGNTTRWGLAWTFDETLALQKAYQTPSMKKTNIPMSYMVPHNIVNDDNLYTLETVKKIIIGILIELEVKYTVKKQNKHLVIIDIRAFKNTWSRQRWKKRHSKKHNNVSNVCLTQSVEKSNIESNLLLALEEEKSDLKRKADGIMSDPNSCDSDCITKKKLHLECNKIFDSCSQMAESSRTIVNVCDKLLVSDSDVHNKLLKIDSDIHNKLLKTDSYIHDQEDFAHHENMLSNKCVAVHLDSQDERKKSEQNALEMHDTRVEEEVCNDPDISTKELNSESNACVPLLEVSLFLRCLASDINLELLWMGGTGGRDAMHQILQYIKNQMKGQGS